MREYISIKGAFTHNDTDGKTKCIVGTHLLGILARKKVTLPPKRYWQSNKVRYELGSF